LGRGSCLGYRAIASRARRQTRHNKRAASLRHAPLCLHAPPADHAKLVHFLLSDSLVAGGAFLLVSFSRGSSSAPWLQPTGHVFPRGPCRVSRSLVATRCVRRDDQLVSRSHTLSRSIL